MKPSPTPVLIRRTPGTKDSYMLFYADCFANRGCIGSREVFLHASGHALFGPFSESSIQFYWECRKASPEEQKRVLDAVAAYEEEEFQLLQRLSHTRLRRNWAWAAAQ